MVINVGSLEHYHSVLWI